LTVHAADCDHRRPFLNTRLSNAEPAEQLCPHCGQGHPSSYTHCPNTGKALQTGRALIGRTIADRYRIVGLLGEGGMGAVYVADHLRIGRKVAIKRLHPQLASDEKAVQRFQREARAAGATGHEHIVEILDLGYTDDGAPYLVMEYLRGLSLAQLLAKETRLPVMRAARIVGQLLAALAAVHENGIVHRDLKPDNVFLTRQGNDPDWVKVLDFGISKMKHEDDGLDLTRTGVTMGTPYYMSPEQARGAKSIDHRADIYAAGVILHQCLTGAQPFAGENYHALLQQILRGDPRPPSAIVPGIARELDEVVTRAMHRDPDKRFANAMEMLEALIPFGAVRPAPRKDDGGIPRTHEVAEPTVRESGVRIDALLATEPLEPTPPPPRAAPSPATRTPAGRDAAPRAKPANVSAIPRATTAPIQRTPVAQAQERYFFAASDDFVAERARSIVPLGRAAVASAPTQGVERSGPTHALREVLNASIDNTPRAVPVARAPVTRERGDATTPIATQVRESSLPPADDARRSTAEPQVKGAIVVGALEHIDAAYGPRTGSLVLVRLEPGLRAKLEGVILPMAMLPLAVLDQLARVTDEVAGRGDGTTAEAIGRACADRELPTTHRTFMQSATPVAAVERLPQLHRSYFSRGDVRVLASGPNAAKIGVDGTGLDTPMLTLWVGGFITRLLELSGARDVRVVPGRGEKGDERGTFAVRWR
jgi:serine/threonine-protein kinase